MIQYNSIQEIIVVVKCFLKFFSKSFCGRSSVVTGFLPAAGARRSALWPCGHPADRDRRPPRGHPLRPRGRHYRRLRTGRQRPCQRRCGQGHPRHRLRPVSFPKNSPIAPSGAASAAPLFFLPAQKRPRPKKRQKISFAMRFCLASGSEKRYTETRTFHTRFPPLFSPPRRIFHEPVPHSERPVF